MPNERGGGRSNDGRALGERGIARIEENIYRGKYDDEELKKVFQTIRVQRRVLRELFNHYHTSETTPRESTADPIRNSTLTHLKELVALEDPPQRWEVI